MSDLPHQTYCAAHPQVCLRMRAALLAAMGPLRLSVERVRVAVAAHGSEVVLADMQQATGLLDEIERRIDSYFDPSSAVGEGEDATAFCRRVRHDLRNPVGAMAGYIELAADGVRSQSEPALADSLEGLRCEVVAVLDVVDSVVRPI